MFKPFIYQNAAFTSDLNTTDSNIFLARGSKHSRHLHFSAGPGGNRIFNYTFPVWVLYTPKGILPMSGILDYTSLIIWDDPNTQKTDPSKIRVHSEV